MMKTTILNRLMPDLCNAVTGSNDGFRQLSELKRDKVYEPVTAYADQHILPVNYQMDPLSKRELEVLRAIEQGLTNQQIADKLFVSLNTIRTHSRNIHSKLDVNTRTRAVNIARQAGIL